MKTVITLAALLAIVGVAQAELDHDGIKHQHSQQNLSKRPYAAPVVKTESFQGAVVDKEQVVKPTQLNLHMLDRRPYMKKAED